MKPKAFLIITAILLLSATASVLDPTGKYLSEAYAQKSKTLKEWVICREKLEAMVDKEDIGTPGFEAAVLQICGKRPVKMAKTDLDLPKADLPFKIDCSELDSARQSICKSYIAKTRDEIYPHLREITSTSLSSCYDAVYYKIISGGPRAGAGGITSRNRITYDQRYSVDLDPPYDVHELLHSISQCNGALDEHVFHGAILNAVYVRLGRKPFYKKESSSENMNRLIKAVETSGGPDLHNKCRAILSEQMTILYFDLGEEAIQKLYRSTISPHPASQPNKQLVNVWGPSATRVQALLEILKREYKYNFSVPGCGY
jgi:hypothetical protein